MVLATVIIAGLIGGGALGLEASADSPSRNLKMGDGVAAGVSIVLLAMSSTGSPRRGATVGAGEPHIVNVPPTSGPKGRTREQDSYSRRLDGQSQRVRVRRRGVRQRQQVERRPLHRGCGDAGSRRHDRRPPAPAAVRRPREPAPAITLAVNPWTGSAVNANVAKVVLESQARHAGRARRHRRVRHLGRAWTTATIDAVLEVWPSGHAADYKTYIDREEDRRRHGPARARGQDRLVRADVRRRRAPRAGDLGGLQGSRRSPSCSPPPSRATWASS